MLGISKTMDISAGDIVFSIILTWGWGLAAPLVLRYAVLKRSLDRTIAFFIVGGLWLLNIFVFTALGSKSRSHAALFFVAAVSYWILTKKTPESHTAVASNLSTDPEPKPDTSTISGQTISSPTDLIDNGFKGKRVRIFLVAAIISASLGAVFGGTSSDWFLAIPAVATVFSVLVLGQPESTRNWRNTIIWSLLLSPPVLLASFVALGIILNVVK
jgi:hypothetical protein